MKLMDLAKKMNHYTNAEILIKRGFEQIEKPQKASKLYYKIQEEVIENYTVLTFGILDNCLIIQVK